MTLPSLMCAYAFSGAIAAAARKALYAKIELPSAFKIRVGTSRT